MDTKAFTTTNRVVVDKFAKARDAAIVELTTNIGSFKTELSDLTVAENQFSENMKVLSTSIQGDAIDSTLATLDAATIDVDTAFDGLMKLIKANDDVAKKIADAIAEAASDIEQINASVDSLGSKVTKYRATIASFRS